LGAGFAFYLILEGLMPFFNPSGFKRLLAMMQLVTDSQVRNFGALMLFLGFILLFSIS
jgi:uncharacterized protein YjeT (DUF2065 family)